MKSKKTIEELDRMADSVMHYLDGEEVIATVDYDSTWFYVWLEPTWGFEDFCEETGGEMLAILGNLRRDLERRGVQQFRDLYSVNQWLISLCGDNEPAEFYYDQWMNVCGA